MSGDPSDEGGEASIRNDDVLRILLVGRTGSGKSSTGNTILGYEAFESTVSLESVTDTCKETSGLVAFREISIVDTPGLFNTRFSEDETIEKVSDCIPLAAPGPHAFLLVVDIASRFTKEEQRSVEIIQKVFGQKSDEYTMVLFTNSDRLKGQTVEDILRDCPKLQDVVSKCKGGYHVFNNETEDPSVRLSQVDELMGKINKMVRKNGGSHYTNEMFQEAAKRMEAWPIGKQKKVKLGNEFLCGAVVGGIVVLGAVLGAVIVGGPIATVAGVLAGDVHCHYYISLFIIIIFTLVYVIYFNFKDKIITPQYKAKRKRRSSLEKMINLKK